MNAAEFLAALNTVEQDHRLVLNKVEALSDIVGGLLDPGDQDPAELVDRLREIYGYFANQFTAHMQEEESTLFPLLGRHAPDGPELVARLRDEHSDIRRKLAELGSCLEVATDLEGGPPRKVLRDLLMYAWDLWEVLDNHAHVETQGVRRCIAASLTSGQ